AASAGGGPGACASARSVLSAARVSVGTAAPGSTPTTVGRSSVCVVTGAARTVVVSPEPGAMWVAAWAAVSMRPDAAATGGAGRGRRLRDNLGREMGSGLGSGRRRGRVVRRLGRCGECLGDAGRSASSRGLRRVGDGSFSRRRQCLGRRRVGDGSFSRRRQCLGRRRRGGGSL